MPRAARIASAQALFARRIGLCCFALLWLQHAHARAEPRPEADAGFWERTRARAELGLSGRSDPNSSFHVLSPILSADYAFSHGFGIGVDWGMLLAAEAPAHAPDAWVAGQGDPWFKLWYTSPAARDRYTLYVGLTVPAAWLPRDVVKRGLTRNAYAFAAATRGLWNAWLWAPEQIALALGGRYERELDPYTRFVLEGAAAGGVSLSRLSDALGTGYLQLGPAVELHERPIALGLRLQGVLTTGAADPLQLGASLYLRLTVSEVQLELGGLCNLYGPLGFTGVGAELCGGWLAVEVRP